MEIQLEARAGTHGPMSRRPGKRIFAFRRLQAHESHDQSFLPLTLFPFPAKECMQISPNSSASFCPEESRGDVACEKEKECRIPFKRKERRRPIVIFHQGLHPHTPTLRQQTSILGLGFCSRVWAAKSAGERLRVPAIIPLITLYSRDDDEDRGKGGQSQRVLIWRKFFHFPSPFHHLEFNAKSRSMVSSDEEVQARLHDKGWQLDDGRGKCYSTFCMPSHISRAEEEKK